LGAAIGVAAGLAASLVYSAYSFINPDAGYAMLSPVADYSAVIPYLECTLCCATPFISGLFGSITGGIVNQLRPFSYSEKNKENIDRYETRIAEYRSAIVDIFHESGYQLNLKEKLSRKTIAQGGQA
jgi:hypothetical protein